MKKIFSFINYYFIFAKLLDPRSSLKKIDVCCVDVFSGKNHLKHKIQKYLGSVCVWLLPELELLSFMKKEQNGSCLKKRFQKIRFFGGIFRLKKIVKIKILK